MSVIRVTKEFSFEMAHALEGYDGACRRIHGHSYRLWVTVKGSPLGGSDSPKQGMVVDFGELKRIVNDEIVRRFDHSLVMRRTTDNGPAIELLSARYGNVIAVDWQPTSENLVSHFVDILRRSLPRGVDLCSVRLSETASSWAEWIDSDNIDDADRHSETGFNI